MQQSRLKENTAANPAKPESKEKIVVGFAG
jgi:hypothetical protein